MFDFLENRIASVVLGVAAMVGIGAVVSVVTDWAVGIDYTPEQKQVMNALEEYLQNRWKYIQKTDPNGNHESHLTQWTADVLNTVTIAKAGNPEMVTEIDKMYNAVKSQLI